MNHKADALIPDVHLLYDLSYGADVGCSLVDDLESRKLRDIRLTVE
jgi:hypothetical protein